MSLSNHIFDDTPPDFFAVLTLRYGRHYIDALDKIEEIQRMRHGVGLTREELMSVCETVIQSKGQDLAAPDPESDSEENITPAAMLALYAEV